MDTIDLDGEDTIGSMVSFLQQQGVKVCISGVVNQSVKARLGMHPWYQDLSEEGGV